ncbi:ABC transporter substrate-binding protein [Bosea sp. (in: a-proteobacteria)]|uniref:ABC transporter substrate-binding protein n=1 Tax=Bosea sp. (in: a-proteobacteria) TaxID=1871050 RepID=UPI00260839B0|nr:ABC transporter substrate-binding protein [Bosea sp. (in: a-proteobacteria)]MCO5091200.1 ABC transporter substrate-binding protein [Bosea sp. (in: a-proteobacteria)]
MLEGFARWRSACAAMIIGLAGAAAPALAQAPSLKPLDPPQTVRVAYVPIMKFATAYVAEARGLFKKYGLDVKLESVKSGTEAIAFLDKGSVDVGGIAIVASLWSAWNRGLDIRVIAPGGLDPMTNGPTKLIVRNDLMESGAIKSVADLKGKRIAAAGGPGSGGEYFVTKALESAGLTLRDVQLLNIGNGDMPAAMEAKSVDAVLTSSPYSDQILKAGNGKLLAQDFTPGLMTVVFVGSGKFLKERPEVAERFVLAMAEAARLMQGADFLAQANIDGYLKYTASTAEAIRNSGAVPFDPNMSIPTAGLADIERVHRENGRTEYDKPLDMAKVVDERFVAKAIEVLGKTAPAK